MKCGNLTFLEPSRPLQACNTTALPFYRSYRQATNHVNHGKAKTAYVIQLKEYIYIGISRALKGERVCSYNCSVKTGKKRRFYTGIFRTQNKISRTYIAISGAQP